VWLSCLGLFLSYPSSLLPCQCQQGFHWCEGNWHCRGGALEERHDGAWVDIALVVRLRQEHGGLVLHSKQGVVGWVLQVLVQEGLVGCSWQEYEMKNLAQDHNMQPVQGCRQELSTCMDGHKLICYLPVQGCR
jgi:hypothetical protein